MDVRINSQPPDDLVYMVMLLDGHLNSVVPQRAPIALSDRAATVGSVSAMNGRLFKVGVELRPWTIVDRKRLERKLTERCRGMVELWTRDTPDEVFFGILENVAVELYTGIYANPICYVEFTFRCDDPAHLDIEPYTRALSSTPVACPVGNGVIVPRIWLYGAATPVVNPEVILYNHAGDEVARLELEVSLGSTAALDIQGQQIDRYLAGVLQTGATNGLACLAGGEFPLLSSEDAAPEAFAHPKIALTAASGTPTGLLIAQRSWS